MKWLHAGLDRRLDQRARIDRVVAVIAERIGDRFRHHDRGGEMDDRVDPVLRDQRGHQRLIAALADDEGGARPATAQRKPVVRLSSTTTRSPASTQRVNHMAADIAGAAGDQDRHRFDLPNRSPFLSEAPMNIPLARARRAPGDKAVLSVYSCHGAKPGSCPGSWPSAGATGAGLPIEAGHRCRRRSSRMRS